MYRTFINGTEKLDLDVFTTEVRNYALCVLPKKATEDNKIMSDEH